MKKNVSANVVKDVTVKQVILTIIDTDKINIVSSQIVLELSSFSTAIRSVSSSPLVNSFVKNRLFKSGIRHWGTAVLIHPHYGFVCGRHGDAWEPRCRTPQDWDLDCLEATAWTQESLAFLDAAVQLLHVPGAVCRCTVLLEQSRYQKLCVSLAAVWRHYDVMKQHRRSQ